MIPFWQLFLDICHNKALLRAAQVQQESAFNPKAVSPVGAQGLGQAMPKTWKWYQDIGWVPRGASPFDPGPAIQGLQSFQGWLEARWQRRGAADWQERSWASYNAGEGNILKAVRLSEALGLPWKQCLPRVTGPRNAKETTDYVAKIPKHVETLKRLK